MEHGQDFFHLRYDTTVKTRKTASAGNRTKSRYGVRVTNPTVPSRITRRGVKQQTATKAVPARAAKNLFLKLPVPFFVTAAPLPSPEQESYSTQQDMLEMSRRNAWAAILIASPYVGNTCTVSIRSSTVSPSFTARTASWIISEAQGARMWTPMT